MATITVTNQIASEALQGQVVTVSLNQTETVSKLPNLVLGHLCTIGSSSNIGYISSIDTYGTSFKVTPQYPFSSFQSTTVGYLTAADTVVIS